MQNGEVSEWFKVQTWNVCAGATLPGVRIPPSPFLLSEIKIDELRPFCY